MWVVPLIPIPTTEHEMATIFSGEGVAYFVLMAKVDRLLRTHLC
jgi:hypothetical protein